MTPHRRADEQPVDGSVQRLDVALAERHLVRSRRQAQDAIAAGHVTINGRPVARASTKVHANDVLVVAVEADPEYASRAGHKLAGALDDLGAAAPDIGGRRCLDVGASTGGFTDVLLRRGAAHVVAIDVGHDQLRPELRDDPRVTAYEGVNARYLEPELVAPAPEIAVADVSFISLTLLLEPIMRACAPGADLLLMVKPQFEIGKERLGSQGVVTSPALRIETVTTVASHARDLGCAVRAVVRSRLPGPNGNVEYFLHLSTPPHTDTHTYDEVVAMITNAVQGSSSESSATPSGRQ